MSHQTPGALEERIRRIESAILSVPLFQSRESEPATLTDRVDVEVTFTKAEDGKVTGLTFRQNTRDMPAQRCE